MLAFQTSGGMEVKKYVAHFMEVAWYVVNVEIDIMFGRNAFILGLHIRAKDL